MFKQIHDFITNCNGEQVRFSPELCKLYLFGNKITIMLVKVIENKLNIYISISNKRKIFLLGIEKKYFFSLYRYNWTDLSHFFTNRKLNYQEVSQATIYKKKIRDP